MPDFKSKFSNPCIPADVIVTPAAKEIPPRLAEPTKVTASFISLTNLAPIMKAISKPN